MKHLMLFAVLFAGFVSSAQATDWNERCRQINELRARTKQRPDPRCGSFGYRPNPRDGYYYENGRYYDSFGREVRGAALELARHLGHGTIDNILYGRRREIDDRYDRPVYDERETRRADRSIEEERDRYRDRVEDLERQQKRDHAEWRREETRRIAREKKELDKRRKELDQKNADIATRERTLAQRDAEASQVMVKVTNYSPFPVCIKRAEDGMRIDNLSLPPAPKGGGYYRLYRKVDLDVIQNGYYEVIIMDGGKGSSGSLVRDPATGGLRVIPTLTAQN